MSAKNSVLPADAPPGLKALIEHCQTIYPDQPNPLQVTTVVKYWLGGQDPLDYISMYFNRGDTDKDIPPHWHYISFGFSDLHGDGRVHIRDSDENDCVRSGMGFELTFRLLANHNKFESENIGRPPTWPANLLQDLARYCFQSGNGLCAGDNIPWRKSLDTSKSRLENILIADDAQLSTLNTPFGTIDFCQIVGVTEEEIDYASRWNGKGVLNLLKKYSQTGGEWLITDMKRDYSIFELFPQTLVSLQDDLEKQGSDLAGVNAHFTFREIQKQQIKKEEVDSGDLIDQCVVNHNNTTVMHGIIKDEECNSISMSISTSLKESCPIDNQPKELNCIVLDGIEITLAPYAAKFLLLAIKDRIRHGRHFTFKSQNTALTFLAESVTGAVVTKDNPYGVIGYWVQIMIDEDLVPRMMDAFKNLSNDTKIIEPIEFDWPDKSLKIIIANPLTSSIKYTSCKRIQ